MKQKHYDVIIAGTGVAGLYAALNLDPSLSILMLSKMKLLLSNSAMAQGALPLFLTMSMTIPSFISTIL